MFQGRFQDLKNDFNRKHSGRESSREHSRRIRLFIPSGPTAFHRGRHFIIDLTSRGVITSEDIVLSVYGSILGIGAC